MNKNIKVFDYIYHDQQPPELSVGNIVVIQENFFKNKLFSHQEIAALSHPHLGKMGTLICKNGFQIFERQTGYSEAAKMLSGWKVLLDDGIISTFPDEWIVNPFQDQI